VTELIVSTPLGPVSVGFGQSPPGSDGRYRYRDLAWLLRSWPAVTLRGGTSQEAIHTVQLTPRESEKLLIFVAADLARRRRARGLRLNLPEAVALITEAMLEGARDGRSVSEVMELARHVLTRADVMDEVPDLIEVVQVEATFRDGTKLVSCHDPIP
jgi:urease subunit gamma